MAGTISTASNGFGTPSLTARSIRTGAIRAMPLDEGDGLT